MLLLVCGAITGGVWLWLDVRVSLNPQANHDAARAQWLRNAPPDYRMWVRVQEPFATSGMYELTVRGRELAQVRLFNTLAFRFDPDAPAFDVPLEQGIPYTVEVVFDDAADLVADLPAVHLYTPGSSHVTYDPVVGYVTRYVRNTCGLALSTVEQCVTDIEVVRFEVLSDDP